MNKQEHRVYTLEDMDKFLEDIDKFELTDEDNEYTPPDQITQALYGLLQKMQDDLKINESATAEIVLTVVNTPLNEMHKKFDINSFFAGAAWYSRELAKAMYELIGE